MVNVIFGGELREKTSLGALMKSRNLEPCRVDIVDDDERFSASLARALKAADIEAACYGNIAEYLLAADKSTAGCMLLDICLPGPNGLELFEKLMTEVPRRPVIFVTGVDDLNLTVQAMRSGARDFILKPVDTARLLRAVTSAFAFDIEQRATHRAAERARAQLATLTPFERKVLLQIARGQRTKQVARELDIGTRTIRTSRENLMMKIEAQSVVDLVRFDAALRTEESGMRLQTEHRAAWQAGKESRKWLFQTTDRP